MGIHALPGGREVKFRQDAKLLLCARPKARGGSGKVRRLSVRGLCLEKETGPVK